MGSRILAVLVLFAGLASGPAWSQAWTPAAGSYVRGQPYTIDFDLPVPVPGFESALIDIFYDDAVFTPLDVTDVHPALAWTASDPMADAGSGLSLVTLAFSAAAPVTLDGTVFSAAFSIKPSAPLGLTTPYAIVSFNEGLPVGPFEAQVTVVPEPGTWALMAVGLGLVVVGAARRRAAA